MVVNIIVRYPECPEFLAIKIMKAIAGDEPDKPVPVLAYPAHHALAQSMFICKCPYKDIFGHLYFLPKYCSTGQFRQNEQKQGEYAETFLQT